MTSYAHQNRAYLPGRPSTLDTSEPSKRAFDAGKALKEPARPSKMVAQDQPKPQPRPSPGLAHEVDRKAFDARWKQEQKAADQDREARKAAFIQVRTDPKTGGQIRTLRKTFNR